MPEVTLRHEIDTDEDTFWSKIVFDEGFNKKLYEGALKFPGWKLLDSKEDDGKITRRVQVDPPVGDLPGPLKKVCVVGKEEPVQIGVPSTVLQESCM